MRRCVYDIEGNELLIRCTEIHCVVVQDLQTRETFRYRPGEIEDAIDKINEYDIAIGHNVLGYDYPVLERLYRPLTAKQADTYIMSRLLYPPSKAPGGGHGLRNYGEYFKFPKTEFHEFAEFTEEMLDYCTQDVHLNTKVYEYLAPKMTQDLWYAYDLECDTRRIITKQEQNGFYVDPVKHQELLNYLTVKQTEVQDEIDKIISPTEYTVKRRQYWIARKPGNLYSGPRQETYQTKTQAKDAGFKEKEITPGPWVEKISRFNANSGDQILEFFQDKYNWQPSVFTDKGNASLAGEILEDLEYPEASLFSEYQLLQKRISQVSSWPEFMINNRVHGSVHSVGAATFRMTHSDPNVSQVTAKGKPYGNECRSCWSATPGKKLVGTDAKGLELRMFANALFPFDGGKYVPIVCYQDPHDYNRRLAGLEERSKAKTAIYAFTYGCGLIKMGKTTEGSESVEREAEKTKIPRGYLRYMEETDIATPENIKRAKCGVVTKRRFMENIAGFQELLDSLKTEWESNDKEFIRGIDGRKIPVEKEHTLLNRRLQSDGAVVMKEALRQHHNRATQEFGPHGDKWAYCANIHDEFQVECDPDIARRMRALGKWSIAKAGSVLELACPLSGDSSIGTNWLSTH